jgi:hypothetical protein
LAARFQSAIHSNARSKLAIGRFREAVPRPEFVRIWFIRHQRLAALRNAKVKDAVCFYFPLSNFVNRQLPPCLLSVINDSHGRSFRDLIGFLARPDLRIGGKDCDVLSCRGRAATAHACAAQPPISDRR